MLMFHGAPQSLITWRLIAPDLARDYTLVMCDLRGYGDSSKPEGEKDHSTYSKRPMAIDHPETVTKLVVMDIVPAHYLYSHVTIDFVQAYFHWFNYLRPAPGPENELLAQNTASPRRPITDEAQLEYRRHNSDPAMLHVMCEDYRASASVDLKIDETDLKAGKRIQCPVRVLWAANGAMGHLYDVLTIWKDEGADNGAKITGKGLPGKRRCFRNRCYM